MKEEALLSKKSAQVPGQYAGYSLQSTRFLHRLLQASLGDTISLEVFDDVGVETPDGFRTAEQSKSTRDANPIANRSKDFWKTLSNWITAVKNGQLDVAKTYFEIYVSKQVSGEIAEEFSSAKTDEQVEKAYLKARLLLWGTSPTYSEKDKLASSIQDFVNHVFETDKELVYSIIKNFSLLCGSGSPIQDVEELVKKHFISEASVQDVVIHGLGWVKRESDVLLEQKKPACISQEDFHKEMTAFTRKVDRQQILESYAPNPTLKQIETDLGLRTYVKQLDVIELDYDDQLSAVTDFLRASADRTAWSERGLVHESSFDSYENDLKRAWINNKRLSDIACSKFEDSIKGQHLYSNCSLHNARLQGMDIPNHFTAGSYHALSDEQVIGWHPDYKNKLKSIDKKGDKQNGGA